MSPPRKKASPSNVSPQASELAGTLGVDVSKVTGTGSGGRVTQADVMQYAAESEKK